MTAPTPRASFKERTPGGHYRGRWDVWKRLRSLPFPLHQGSSSRLGPLPQQSRVLHKLVPVYVVLKEEQVQQ